MMGTVWRYLVAIKGSIFGFLAAIGLAFLTLGYSSLVLYAVASPVLGLIYPPMADWHGPWVWPVLVGVTILWAPGFLMAGILDHRLAASGWSSRRRSWIYLAVLWLAAVLSWLVILGANFPPGGRG